MLALRIVALASLLTLVAPKAHADVMRGEPPAAETTPTKPSTTPEPEKAATTTEPAKLTEPKPEPAKPSSETSAPPSSGSCSYGALAGNFFGAVVVSGALLSAFGRRRSRVSARA
jgi:hypothetical protein